MAQPRFDHFTVRILIVDTVGELRIEEFFQVLMSHDG